LWRLISRGNVSCVFVKVEMSASTSSADLGPADVGRHLFVLNLHVEMLKIINIVWCRFQDFKY